MVLSLTPRFSEVISTEISPETALAVYLALKQKPLKRFAWLRSG
jgi:hypothetical protein